MAKLSFLGEVVCAALFTSAILWQESSSSSLGPFSSTVTEETTTTNDRGSDGCDNITCPLGKHCVLDSENSPNCVCNDVCYLIYAPVCGSDGHTYDNDCFLGVEACKTNTNITIEHEGRCNDSSKECNITCPLGKLCIPNAENRPECVCNEACSLIYLPVCGSDGNTYDNPCVLGVEACKTNSNITIQHLGSCNDSCTGFECPNYGRCVVDSDDRPTCVCRLGCPRIYSPVCGSDNETYDNECLLQAQACQTNTSISILHEGECAGEVSEATVTAFSTPSIPPDHPTKKPKCPGHKKEC